MNNPLYDQFASPNDFSAIRNEAMKLKQQILNPKAEVERLLQSGQMSQAQFNYLRQMANQIIPHL